MVTSKLVRGQQSRDVNANKTVKYVYFGYHMHLVEFT